MNKDDREECEWVQDVTSWYYPKCSNPTNGMNIFDVKEFKYCPYCGKPIKIKGDK